MKKAKPKPPIDVPHEYHVLMAPVLKAGQGTYLPKILSQDEIIAELKAAGEI